MEDAVIPQPAQRGAPNYPMPQLTYNASVGRDSGYIEKISDLNREFEVFQHTLAGEVEVKTRDEKDARILNRSWQKQFDPMISDEGCFRLVSFIRDSLLNTNTYFSYTNEEQVVNDCRANARAIREHLFYNRHNYRINPENFNYLCNAALNLVTFAVRRSQGAKTLNLTSGAVQQQFLTQDIKGGQKPQRRVLGVDLPF